MTRTALLALALTLTLIGCDTEQESIVCGPGTLQSANTCQPAFDRVECDPGTHLEGDRCVLDAPPIECGPGTHVEDDRCVLDAPPVACGPGTHLEGDRCVLDAPPIECGPGTELEEGECVLREAPLECGEGTIERGGACVDATVQRVSMPFEAGRTVIISQGHHGQFSHKNKSVYAIDVPVPEGTPVAAARSGRVWRTRSDSDTGCGEPSCGGDANYVMIDHGDGTIGLYFHLEQGGVAVEVGQSVCTGQIIGSSGNTGFSTGPHLHFEIQDLFGHSQPMKIVEFEPISGGTPFSRQPVESQNVDPGACDEDFLPSDCPQDVFAHMGVALDPGVPCTTARLDQVHTISGQVLASDRQLLIGRFNTGIGEWSYNCVMADETGRFEAELTWPSDTFAGQSFMMLSAATQNCGSIQGWDASPRIVLSP